MGAHSQSFVSSWIFDRRAARRRQEQIIRALHCVLQHTAGGRKHPSPANAGKPWTEADDSALLQMYDAGSDVEELKTHFQRSRTAIIRRLERLGRVRPGELQR